MNDITQTGDESGDPDKTKNSSLRTAYTRFKLLPITWRISGAALLGVLILGAFARFLPDMKERMKFFTDAAFAWLVFVVVVVQSYIYSKQTDIMGASMVVSSQAYVCIRDISLDLVEDRILIEVENLGRVPADSIDVGVWLRLEIPSKPEQKNPTFQSRYYFGRNTELLSGNLPLNIRIVHSEWLRSDHVDLIKSGDGLLVVEGLITFHDGFLPRRPKKNHFAFAYRLGDKRFFPQRVLSPEELIEQETKQQAPKQNPN